MENKRESDHVLEISMHCKILTDRHKLSQNFLRGCSYRLSSQPQSITQKGVHAHPSTAQEREHWVLQHLNQLPAANFGRQ